VLSLRLSEEFAGALRNVAPPGPGVCPVCWTFHDPDFARCHACPERSELDVVAPISYALDGGELACALRGYKDEPRARDRYHHGIRLAAVLARFLGEHEGHVARAAGTDAFDVVTVVPSRTGLGKIAGTVVGHTAGRYERLLGPAGPGGRRFDRRRYVARRPLHGEPVLLIDDAWVSGSSAQSAAAALRDAGASHVACVVIGRWLAPAFGPAWGPVERLYAQLPAFDWSRCAAEAPSQAPRGVRLSTMPA